MSQSKETRIGLLADYRLETETPKQRQKAEREAKRRRFDKARSAG